MTELQGRTALVTGGSKGIGLASGVALASQGAKVALTSRDQGQLDAAADQVRAAGGEVATIAADLSTAAGAQAVVDGANAALGQVDILVNAAGASPPGTIDVLTDEQWDIAIDLKFRGYIRMTRAFLPGMVERGFGRIINVAGNAGKQPGAWLITSGTINAAIMAMTRAVGNSVVAKGVTVNAVCPGPTDTDRWTGMQKVFAESFDVSPDEAHAKIVSGIPAGRVATPEEVAYAVAFFASERAGHITGDALMIDGGQVGSI